MQIIFRLYLSHKHMTFIQIEIFLEVYKTSPTLKAVTHFEALNCYKKSDTCLYKFFGGK